MTRDSLTWERSMARFFLALRKGGLRLSTAEALDALAALEHIDLSQREEVRAALKVMLVKNPQQAEIFHHIFEAFFAPPRVKERLERARQEGKEREEERLRQAERELTFQEEALDLSKEEKLLYGSLAPEDQKRLQDFLEKSSKGKKVDLSFKPIIERLVRGQLELWRRQLENPLEFQLPDTEDADLDNIMQHLHNTLPQSENLLVKTDIAKIPDKDLPQVTALLKKISRRLAGKISRRYRLSRKSVCIDIRRTIHGNLRYGGAMFRLNYRRRRTDKPRVLLLCDVSGSMARYATFVLQFIYGLSSAVRDIESFVFAEEMERVTPFFQQGRPFEVVMKEVMANSRIWGKGTNLAGAARELRRDYPLLLTRKTLMVLLSDGKTLYPEDAAARLAAIRGQVKDILWLNTLPRREWKRVAHLDKFRKWATMYECYTIEHLQNILHRHL